MPSAADLIFVAILGVLLLTPLSVKLLNDAGIGWHIRDGQQILSAHAIPRVDPFSSQIRKPWIAWEWLYDVIVGRLETSAGLNGVVWFAAIVIAATFALLFRLLLRRGADFLAALVLTLLAISASMIHFLARPHVLSWLFVVVWFWILQATDRSRRLWLLPALMLLWANLHGGFLLGFVLLGAFWVESVWTWLRSNPLRIEDSLEGIAAGKRAWQLTLVGLASPLATFVNPYGWSLHEHIYSYLTNRFFMDHIDEFQSPNFHGIAQKCFLALLLIAVATLVARVRRLKLREILLLMFAIFAALFASRNIPVSSVLLVLIVGPLIPSLALAPLSRKMHAVDTKMKGHLWPIVAAVAAVVVALHDGRVGSTQLMDAHFDPQRMPVGAVNFIEAHEARAVALHAPIFSEIPQCRASGPLASPDYWGGYLIYRLYPNNTVTVDDRHDFYGEWLMRRYLTIMHLEPGWEKTVEWGGCLILPRTAPLSAVLGKMPAWKRVYSDDVATVFVDTSVHEDRDKVPSR